MSCVLSCVYFANPAFAQIHPTCVPVHGDKQSKLTLMSESLRNDGRIWVPKKLEDAKALQAGTKKPNDIPDEDRDFYLERRYPAFGNLVPRDVASRAAKERCDAGFGVNNTGLAVFLDFKYAIEKITALEKVFWSDLRIPGEADSLNIELEKALRLWDFIETGKLMAYDALNREESCGGHFREEYQTPEGEALRRDDEFSYVACWKYEGEGKKPELLKEPLNYEYIKVQTRNYKS